MSVRPTASVVICAYTEQRWDDLLAAIESCEQQTVAPLETIVVVDHNPGLLRRLRSEGSHVKAIENGEERGLSGARLTAPYADEAVIGVGGSIDPVWPRRRRPAALPPNSIGWPAAATAASRDHQSGTEHDRGEHVRCDGRCLRTSPSAPRRPARPSSADATAAGSVDHLRRLKLDHPWRGLGCLSRGKRLRAQRRR